ncbi:MAG: reprolysin-like metallopeptidase [Pseudomonas sp.]
MADARAFANTQHTKGCPVSHIKRLTTFLLLCCALRLSTAMASDTLIVHVYLHDELAAVSEQSLHSDYLQHWEDEMHTFTSHPIEVVFHRDIAGITDIDYAASNDAAATLEAFNRAVAELKFQHYPRGINKSILVTESVFQTLDNGYETQGLAQFEGNFAIASRGSYASLAHEIGHMLGATHENAEKQIKVWPLKCETYVFPQRAWDRAHCYRYSDANRDNITAHLQSHSQ